MAKEIVGEMIDEWLTGHSSRSVALLVKLSKVSDSALRRIRDGSQVASLESIVAIGCATGQHDKMLAAVETYYPHCVNFLAKIGVAEGPQIEGDPSDLLSSSVASAIFISLLARKSLTRAAVGEQFGRSGTDVLEKLVSLGIAREDDHAFVPIAPTYTYKTVQELLTLMGTLVSSFDKASVGSHTARLGMLTDALDPQGCAAVQNILDNAMAQIREVMDKHASVSGEVIAVSVIMQPVK